jgi:hypothetical protein
MSFQPGWKDYFTFNRRERNGAVALLLICLIILGWLTYFRFYYQPEKLQPDKKFIEEVAIFEAKIKASASLPSEKPVDHKHQLGVISELFAFNPNELNDSISKNLGLPAYLASRMMNYVNKGGRFRIKKDLLRIYGMDTALYYRLEPYLTLPDTLTEHRKPASDISDKVKTETVWTVIDLNTCRLDELISISGIGEWRANKILNYRHRLGGFTETEQLLETGALDTALFNQIKHRLKIGTPVYRKIHLKNFQCHKIFHPYLNRQLCHEIEKKLFLNPHLKSLDELRSLPSMNDSIWQKIYPYLLAD